MFGTALGSPKQLYFKKYYPNGLHPWNSYSPKRWIWRLDSLFWWRCSTKACFILSRRVRGKILIITTYYTPHPFKQLRFYHSSSLPPTHTWSSVCKRKHQPQRPPNHLCAPPPLPPPPTTPMMGPPSRCGCRRVPSSSSFFQGGGAGTMDGRGAASTAPQPGAFLKYF